MNNFDQASGPFFYTMGQVAQDLSSLNSKITEHELLEALQSMEVLTKSGIPTKSFTGCGFFMVCKKITEHSDEGVPVTLVTDKGVELIREKYRIWFDKQIQKNSTMSNTTPTSVNNPIQTQAGTLSEDKKIISSQSVEAPVNKPQEGLQKVPSGFSGVEQFISSKGWRFRFNEVTDRVEIYSRHKCSFIPLNNFTFNSIYRKLKKNGNSITITELQTLLNSDFISKYNPFVEYFENLEPWDGKTDYIAALAATVGTTQKEYWEKCLKKWLVATVACALKPNVANHTVIVFSGNQGIGKSTWLNKLVPSSLQDYYRSGYINPESKDTAILLSECLLINLDELEGLSRGQIGGLKELTTRSQIKERRPYARFHENYERRASFVASINHTEFLVDTTGNRRWLCFEVECINTSHSVNMDLVFAQALHLLNSDFQYWFDLNDIQEVNMQNNRFEVQSIEEEFLLKYFSPGTSDEEFMTASEIKRCIELYAGVPLSSNSLNKLGQLLKKHRFKRIKKKVYGYVVRPNMPLSLAS